MKNSASQLNIALLCGGPSLERGISLNSARSVCDHLHSKNIKIVPIYFDHDKNPYQISRAQLYSNTPSDFDFKLAQTAKPLSKSAFHKLLKSVDLAFPVMHGNFGEDGEIQKILEEHKIPYIGSNEQACKICFDKYRANEFIKKHGFYTLPSTVLKIHQADKHLAQIQNFFQKNDVKRAIVKPATGGSSIGVHSVCNIEEALDASHIIFSKRMDTRVVIEPFCTGIEFTVIVLQNKFDLPVAILPTEIESDYAENQIFDFRKKYLASRQVTYHCPPRFPDQIVEKIQIQAEQLFQALGMRDFARFDGWLLRDGNIWFSDFNPISGMEQNSFLFMQSSQIGFSHHDLLSFIVKNACRRYEIPFPIEQKIENEKKKISVLFGGVTVERQVSVMSGTNVWLKLRNSQKYNPEPYLLDLNNDTVWKLPYAKTLNHTVEEISETCHTALKAEERIKPLRHRILEKLFLDPNPLDDDSFLPEKMTLSEFIENSKFVFIGLHGGIGEDGRLQERLEKAAVPFNGSDSKASRLCIDKYQTGEKLKKLADRGVYVPNKILLESNSLLNKDEEELALIWKKVKTELNSSAAVIKPRGDGCSAGIVKLESSKDFIAYVNILSQKLAHIPPNTFKNQFEQVEMPHQTPEHLICEQFIQTDRIRIVRNNLKWEKVSGWIEITMGVLEVQDELRALNPSLTVASGQVLSLEEKFQGGTGVNITPPPQPFVKKKAIVAAKKRMELVAKTLGISGYARIDSFMECNTGELMIIEANSTPGLTPSTVIYHQALAEEMMMYPLEFLEKIIENAINPENSKLPRNQKSLKKTEPDSPKVLD